MTNRHRRDQPGDFDMSFLVPGLPFFEDMGQSLSDAIYRLFDHVSNALDRLRHRIQARRDHTGHDLRRSNDAVSPFRPVADSPDTDKN